VQNRAASKDVSDIAIWVAQYRARETERPDAMIRDPVEWTVLARMVNIDEFVFDGVRDAVDAVLNIGAGLGARGWNG
jgi:O-methyltransferase involved in polyketide biosynthesis